MDEPPTRQIRIAVEYLKIIEDSMDRLERRKLSDAVNHVLKKGMESLGLLNVANEPSKKKSEEPPKHRKSA